MGHLTLRALSFGVHVRAPDYWKLSKSIYTIYSISYTIYHSRTLLLGNSQIPAEPISRPRVFSAKTSSLASRSVGCSVTPRIKYILFGLNGNTTGAESPNNVKKYAPEQHSV